MAQHIDDGSCGDLEGNTEPVALVVFAVIAQCGVHGDNQRLKPGVFGSLHQLIRQRLVLPHIQLEPEAAASLLRNFFHRRYRTGRQGKRHTGIGRSFGQGKLTFVGTQTGNARWRDGQGHG
ncbi:hypothetical protein MDG893_15250 [Marinobacter algicola DG893]|uniref:Uncharacterized protein n=1 Tax=Marinobacter algicola DG893 TaxID=443152 RepID=A6F045_9GAMM|nr:hypothetical protein MDG893_15250 [Marinobacter algicola DG893]